MQIWKLKNRYEKKKKNSDIKWLWKESEPVGRQYDKHGRTTGWVPKGNWKSTSILSYLINFTNKINILREWSKQSPRIILFSSSSFLSVLSEFNY